MALLLLLFCGSTVSLISRSIGAWVLCGGNASVINNLFRVVVEPKVLSNSLFLVSLVLLEEHLSPFGYAAFFIFYNAVFCLVNNLACCLIFFIVHDWLKKLSIYGWLSGCIYNFMSGISSKVAIALLIAGCCCKHKIPANLTKA